VSQIRARQCCWIAVTYCLYGCYAPSAGPCVGGCRLLRQPISIDRLHIRSSPATPEGFQLRIAALKGERMQAVLREGVTRRRAMLKPSTVGGICPRWKPHFYCNKGLTRPPMRANVFRQVGCSGTDGLRGYRRGRSLTTVFGRPCTGRYSCIPACASCSGQVQPARPERRSQVPCV